MAYTNFQNCTQEEYNEIIYSGDAKHRLKLLFNGVEYPTANSKTESIKRIGKILSDGGERFSLDNFKAQTLELIIHDIDLEDIQEPISISIGTLVDDENDTYEYVPIGIFNLDETPTTSSDKTTIKVSDNASKFDFLYDASGVIERNGGEATMLQILQDICDKARVTLETTSFPNMNTKVSVWDNSINARQYVMYIGEKAGRIPNISRTGGLILIDLQSNETVEVESEDGIIEIDDALARTPEDLQLQGNTYQQTYTGKNLLKNTSTNSGDNNYWSQYSTYDQTTGTLTRSTSGTTEQFIRHQYNLKNNTKYTISCLAKSNGYVTNFEILAYNSTASKVYGSGRLNLTQNFQKYYLTFTTDSSTNFTNANIRFDNNGSTQSGTTATLTIKDVMLVEGEDTNFEPYVGGTASPNPDYPQAINNVTGRQTIDVVGKNLLNVNLDEGTAVTIKMSGSELIMNGTTSGAGNLYNNNNAFTLPAGTYTFSSKILSGSFERNSASRDTAIYFRNSNSNVGLFTITGEFNYNNTSTITLSEETTIRLQIYTNGSGMIFNNLKIGIQLEKGSTATTYEEYKGQSYEINLGKNLFDGELELGYYNDNGVKTNSNTNYRNKNIIAVNPNTTYTFSINGTSQKYVVYYYNESQTFINVEGLTTGTFTTPSNCNYLNFRCFNADFTNNYANLKVQLEKGSQPTSYSEYFTPIELNKIGNYQDSIKKSTGKNLFDKNNVTDGKRFGSDGVEIDDVLSFISDYIKVQPNTSYTANYTIDWSTRIVQYDSSKNIINVNTSTSTFTTLSNTEYIRITRRITDKDTTMINEGTTALPYEPYLPIGTWYIESKIGKVVYNGSESNWNYDGQRYSIALSNVVVPPNNDTKGDGYSNVGIITANQTLAGSGYSGVAIHPISRIYISSGVYDNLSTTNVILYYKYITPEYEIITNQELINQLESIELLNGINNITVSSGDLAGGLKITYDKINDGIELDPLLFEKYTEGDLLEITRVVYEDAIRKFEYGDETGATLYINSANPYIVDASEIYNIYLQVRGLSLYSMKISKMIGNPALDPWDIIKFTYKNKEYRTLAQNTLTYNGVITQSFDTQIGTKEKSQENVTINSENANFKRLYTRMDQAEGNIELNASQVSSIQSDLKENYFDKTSTEQLILNSSTGLTNTFSEAGGNNIFRNTGLWFEQDDENNPYEFWNGKVARNSNDKASNKNSLLLQNGALSQEQDVPNGNYTVSFKYIKLIPLSVVKCYINDIEYELTETTDTEFQEIVEVNSQHINVRFVSDTNDSCEIYDLMVNAGSVKLAYSQNQNETTTDTVNISKGITITSSDQQNVVFKANADGVRIFEKSNMTTPKTKFTDKGTETNYLEAKDEAIIVDVLIQRVGNQTWFTKI